MKKITSSLLALGIALTAITANANSNREAEISLAINRLAQDPNIKVSIFSEYFLSSVVRGLLPTIAKKIDSQRSVISSDINMNQDLLVSYLARPENKCTADALLSLNKTLIENADHYKAVAATKERERKQLQEKWDNNPHISYMKAKAGAGNLVAFAVRIETPAEVSKQVALLDQGLKTGIKPQGLGDLQNINLYDGQSNMFVLNSAIHRNNLTCLPACNNEYPANWNFVWNGYYVESKGATDTLVTFENTAWTNFKSKLRAKGKAAVDPVACDISRSTLDYILQVNQEEL